MGKKKRTAAAFTAPPAGQSGSSGSSGSGSGSGSGGSPLGERSSQDEVAPSYAVTRQRSGDGDLVLVSVSLPGVECACPRRA
jgi:hypothetical protein